MNNLSFFILFILLTIILKLTESATELCNPNDKKVLLQIKNHFHNAPYFDTWKPTADCCNSWDTIGCNLHGRVNDFTVAHTADVAGVIPPAIGDLPYLTNLQFFGVPKLTGSIPLAITKLKYLETLSLIYNNLTGPVPDFLSRIKSLKKIELYYNNLSGSIPSSLSLLPNLNELNLFNNKLTGSIPESFGSLKTGFLLQLSRNKLSGPIPRSFGRSNLTILDVSENGFTGDVSFLFGRGKQYTSLVLNNNQFKFNLTNVVLPRGLLVFDISYNNIYGSLPKELAQLGLNIFDVSHNQLCGPVPTGSWVKEFGPEKFAHNKCLCGAPLPPCK